MNVKKKDLQAVYNALLLHDPNSATSETEYATKLMEAILNNDNDSIKQAKNDYKAEIMKYTKLYKKVGLL